MKVASYSFWEIVSMILCTLGMLSIAAVSISLGQKTFLLVVFASVFSCVGCATMCRINIFSGRHRFAWISWVIIFSLMLSDAVSFVTK